MRRTHKLRLLAVVFMVAAYAGLSHYCNSSARNGDLGAAVALGPISGLALLLAWRRMAPLLATGLTVLIAVLLMSLWPQMRENFPLISLTEETGVYLVLGTTFARSLMPGRTALCTKLADQVHGPLSPREIGYTRYVTAAWVGFFFLIATVSNLLYFGAPLRLWSIYINFCVPLLMTCMFVGELLVRRRVLPHLRAAGLLSTVRVYFTNPQSS